MDITWEQKYRLRSRCRTEPLLIVFHFCQFVAFMIGREYHQKLNNGSSKKFTFLATRTLDFSVLYLFTKPSRLRPKKSEGKKQDD